MAEVIPISLDKPIRICLVYPRLKSPTGDPPLGLAYIASSLKATGKADVRIFDATFQPSIRAILSFIDDFAPEIVGIYCDTLMSRDAIDVAAAAKERGIFVMMGGPHPTVLPESVIAVADLVVIGEGERTVAEVLERFRERDFGAVAGIWFKRGEDLVKNPARRGFSHLDELRFPAYELLDMKSYLAQWNYLDCVDVSLQGTNIVGSRGCPFDCTYCQPTLRSMFGSKTRYRSAESIVSELAYLKQNYGLNAFFFHDDTLTANRERLLSLCDRLVSSGLEIRWACNTRVDTIDREMMEVMYAAGLRKLHIGAESGSQRILDQIYSKKITTEQVRQVVETAQQIGIRCFCFFILGAPGETRQELAQTVKFACSLPIDEVSFSMLTPLPGTKIGTAIAEDPRYAISGDFSRYNYHSRRSFTDPGLSGRRVKLIQVVALIRFYTHYKRWPYLASHFTTPGGMRKLFRKVARFFR